MQIYSIKSILKIFLDIDKNCFFSFSIPFLLSLFFVLSFFVFKKSLKGHEKKTEESWLDFLIFLSFKIVFSAFIMSLGIVLCKLIPLNFQHSNNYYISCFICFICVEAAYIFFNPEHKSILKKIKISSENAKKALAILTRLILFSFFIINLEFICEANEFYRSFISLFCSSILVFYYSNRIIFYKKNIRNFFKNFLSENYSTFAEKNFSLFLHRGCDIFVAVMIIFFYNKIITSSLFFYNLFFNIIELLVIFAIYYFFSLEIVEFLVQKIKSSENGSRYAKLKVQCLIDISDTCSLLFIIGFSIFIIKYYNLNLYKTIVTAQIFDVFIIFIFAVFVYRISEAFFANVLEVNRASDLKSQKIYTFLPIINIMTKAIIFVISLLTILLTLNINIGPIVGVFSALLVTLSLASQDIVKSFLQGLVLLSENRLYVGHYISVNGISGTILQLSIRSMYIKDDKGCVHSIPYSSVSTISNYSLENTIQKSLLCIDDGDINLFIQFINDIVAEMRLDSKYKNMILSDPIIYGLKPFDLEGLKITWGIVTTPDPKNTVSLEFYKRLAIKLHEENIPIPRAKLV